MYCMHCGAPNEEDHLFCIHCGKALRPASQEEITDWYAPTEPEPPAPVPLPPVRKIGFGEAVKNFFTHYADFKGRATRREYWFAYLFFYILVYALSFALAGVSYIIPFTESGFNNFYSASILIFLAIFIVPTQSLIWRRLHDAGKSGGCYFLCFLPIANMIAMIWICFFPSDGDNKYGPRKVDAQKGISPDLYS